METKYKCSKCDLSVIVIDKVTIKACNCIAPIIASISAVTNGQSSIK